jgi:hypothetical protein
MSALLVGFGVLGDAVVPRRPGPRLMRTVDGD